MGFRSSIKNFLPYCFVVSYMKRHKHKFVFDKDSVISNSIDFDNHSFFKTIVSVEGFGYSGSGAVVDLLREYQEVIVMGGVDAEGSLAKKNSLSQEMDFIRLTGGLLELEKYIEGNNVFFNDAVIHRLIKLVQSSSLFAVNPKARQLFNVFFAKIVDFSIDGLPTPMYNTYLDDADNNIYFIKPRSIKEYRKLCSKLIVSIFNCYETEGKDILIADQLFSDLEFDYERNREYLPNLKTIVVYRDPRDVYAFACQKPVTWIPHDNVDIYIKWVKTFYLKFNRVSKDYLVVRYEELINDYEVQKQRIEEYLGIKNHNAPLTCFNPAISSRYVGLWKTSNLPLSAFERIKSELSDLCFEG